MIDPAEKSTQVRKRPPAQAEVADGVILDGRLGLFHCEQRWLAVSDLHFGYEVSRRRNGGLWPMWGMNAIEERLEDLIRTLCPDRVILLGDVVDSSAAAPEAIQWVTDILSLCNEVTLIEGNHDRGEVKRHFSFVSSFQTEGFFFHHGHRNFDVPANCIEVTGHYHPSISFSDGAGTLLRLPTLAMEQCAETRKERWTMPAFSPWAGGYCYTAQFPSGVFRQFACSTQRVFETG